MRSLVGIACAAWLLIGWSPTAAAQTFNECGCYQDDSGGCKCTRKSKCGCPGECEPVGCEEKRVKEAEKAAEAELKRIAAREKKKAAEAARAAKQKEKAEKASEKAGSKAPEKSEKAARSLDEILRLEQKEEKKEPPREPPP
jgi:hypothetical protein